MIDGTVNHVKEVSTKNFIFMKLLKVRKKLKIFLLIDLKTKVMLYTWDLT